MRRYVARPDVKKTELIKGVVSVASPVHIEHGELHHHIVTWIGVYKAATPGLRAADNTTWMSIGKQVFRNTWSCKDMNKTQVGSLCTKGNISC